MDKFSTICTMAQSVTQLGPFKLPDNPGIKYVLWLNFCFLQTVSNCAEGSPMANQAACFVAEALTDDNDHRAVRAADYDPMGLFDLS